MRVRALMFVVVLAAVAEMIKSFDDMVKWATAGTKPDGDDVDADLSNAGLTFTQPLRANDPGGIRIAPQSR